MIIGPYVQLFDFDGAGDTFNVLYKSDRISVEYNDDLTGSVSVALDRADAPQGAMVHITISDTRLNLDPTGQDTWVLYLNDTLNPQLRDHTAAIADGATDYVFADDFDAVALGSDGHGNIDLPDALVVGERTGFGGLRAADADGNYIVFEETERNSGVFVSFIAADYSPINIGAEAFINAGITVEYAGASASVTVRDESTDIAITSDDFWNSGEPATVTVTAPNLDLNTMDDDDVTIKSELIPTIEIGDPITITDFNPKVDYVNYTSTTATHTTFALDNDGVNVPTDVTPGQEAGATANRTSINGLATTTQMFAPDGDDDDSDPDRLNPTTTATGMETDERPAIQIHYRRSQYRRRSSIHA